MAGDTRSMRELRFIKKFLRLSWKAGAELLRYSEPDMNDIGEEIEAMFKLEKEAEAILRRHHVPLPRKPRIIQEEED